MVTERRVDVGDVVLNVATAGAGPAVLLVHGWPHTWRMWTHLIETLSRRHRVIAPDLRGLGASDRPAEGYDGLSVADDLAGLLEALDVPEAGVVAIDAGVAPAFLLGMRRPERVSHLVLMEGLLGRLPGAEAFTAAGPPWWFGFHGVQGLAERVLVGHEAEYVDWFLETGTRDGRGIDPGIRDAFVAAYTGADALRGGFEHYRAMPATAGQVAAAVDGTRLRTPVLAVAGGMVGEALAGQLAPVADDLRRVAISDCAHLVPLEQPAPLLDAMLPFLAGTAS